MRFFSKGTLAKTAMVILPLGGISMVAATTGPAAQATTSPALHAAQATAASNNGEEICAAAVNQLHVTVPVSPCMDSYNNGGPLVKSYAPGNTYEDYYTVDLGNGTVQVVNGQNGECVGDYGNNPSDARVGNNLRCPSQGNAGWGTVFTFPISGCPGDGAKLRNNRWGGYMMGAVANGSQWYLNNSSSVCLDSFF